MKTIPLVSPCFVMKLGKQNCLVPVDDYARTKLQSNVTKSSIVLVLFKTVKRPLPETVTNVRSTQPRYKSQADIACAEEKQCARVGVCKRDQINLPSYQTGIHKNGQPASCLSIINMNLVNCQCCRSPDHYWNQIRPLLPVIKAKHGLQCPLNIPKPA